LEIFREKLLSIAAKSWLKPRNFRRSFVWVLIFFYSIVSLLKFWALRVTAPLVRVTRAVGDPPPDVMVTRFGSVGWRVTRPLMPGDLFWFWWLAGDPPSM
jgi:hypothetical protein